MWAALFGAAILAGALILIVGALERVAKGRMGGAI
jgi:NitT/TauT family transport system permease protein